MATYDATKPNSAESPSLAPAQLNDNFAVAKTIVSQDHQWNDTPVTDSGKHDKSTYTEQGTEPTTIANESSIYAVVGPTSGETELYIRRENSTGALTVPTKDLAIFGVASAGLFNASAAALGNHNVNMTATRNSVGDFTANFTNPMPDTNYMVVICAENSSLGTASKQSCSWRIHAKTVNDCRIIFTSRPSGTASFFDPPSWNVIIYGGIQ